MLNNPFAIARRLIGLTLLLPALAARADDAKIGSLTLDVGNATKTVSPTFYGLMTEEINHSYDGGLYAELIQNRSFADNNKEAVHWSLDQSTGSDASISLDDTHPVNDSLPTSLKLDVRRVNGGRVGIANEGFWGIPLKPDTTYRACFYARTTPGSTGSLTVEIKSDNGGTSGPVAHVDKVSDQWQKFTVSLKTGTDIRASSKNHFVISTSNPGSFWFSLVSLFPPTWHDRPNGNRVDLMQLMTDLKPAFLRCPGGNYLEGNSVDTRFAWKKTLGDLSNRPGHMGTWRYRSSDGLGLLEFLEWSEDIGADPLLAVWAGYSLPTKEHRNGTTVPAGAELKPFVDEAVEEVEYATGDAHTTWGARRIADGHPQPFRIHYIEIGNEDFLGGAAPSYDARFAQFYDALKAAYPSLKFIATIPVKSRVPDAVDEHYYKTSDQMATLAHQYDKTSRTGPKVFVGEWATREVPKVDSHGKLTFTMMPWSYLGGPTPTMHAALGDAAFMTGLERNADVVVMNCYAPMLTRIDPGAAQWCPNMLGYNAINSFASPSYYVQQMFNQNLGDVIVPASAPDAPRDLLYCATRSSKTGKMYLKVVNRATTPVSLQIVINGAGAIATDGELTQLKATDPLAMNSVDQPRKTAPVKSALHDLKSGFTHQFPAESFSVLALDSTSVAAN